MAVICVPYMYAITICPMEAIHSLEVFGEAL